MTTSTPLTTEENKLILDHLELAAVEATRHLKYFYHGTLDYDDLYSVGCLTIVEIISSGKYKEISVLRAFLRMGIRYALINAAKANSKYVCIEENDKLDVLVNNAQDEKDHEDTFDYDRAQNTLVFLSPEEQKILRYMHRDGLRIVDICKRLHLSKATIDNRIRKIKTKMRKEYQSEHSTDGI